MLKVEEISEIFPKFVYYHMHLLEISLLLGTKDYE